MRKIEARELKTLSISVIGRELASAADRSLWADNREECVSIVTRLYKLFDDLELGVEPNLCSRLIAAATAVWIGDNGRYAKLLSDVTA